MNRRRASTPLKKKEQISFVKTDKTMQLMDFLLESFPEKKRSKIKSLLTHGQVLIDNKIVTQYNHLLPPGQEIMINWTRVQKESDNKSIRIVFEDPHFIVIDKKAGLLSVSTRQENEQTAFSILEKQLKKDNYQNELFTISLLDKSMSGLMLFAKERSIRETFLKSPEKVKLSKSFCAVAEGIFKEPEATLINWLKENKAYVMYDDGSKEDAQQAITHYKVRKTGNELTMLEIETETEIKNQIRAQFKALGHSIVGDKKYGATFFPIKRLALHAFKLSFIHPITGREMTFESRIPLTFHKLLKKQPN
ncbi:MAG: RluA family pseudouridine synthase [Candidatus Cloacimonetes bacterium]|nr:RluA family pseudouridine synthase [Candidatus Cloacimonadota bacterium]